VNARWTHAAAFLAGSGLSLAGLAACASPSASHGEGAAGSVPSSASVQASTSAGPAVAPPSPSPTATFTGSACTLFTAAQAQNVVPAASSQVAGPDQSVNGVPTPGTCSYSSAENGDDVAESWVFQPSFIHWDKTTPVALVNSQISSYKTQLTQEGAQVTVTAVPGLGSYAEEASVTTPDGPQCYVDWSQGPYVLELDVKSSGDIPDIAASTAAEAKRLAAQF
jgi:hypothetical protein